MYGKTEFTKLERWLTKCLKPTLLQFQATIHATGISFQHEIEFPPP